MPGPWATVYAAARDRRSGSAEVARAAARALAELRAEDVPRAVEVLLTGHPSMAALWRLGTDVLSARDPGEGARRFLERLEADRGAAELLAPALPPWVLTISYSSSVLETLRRARLRLVTCMESLPGGEGRRMAEALSEWCRTRVVPDEEAIRLVPGAAVVVGCDALSPEAVVNKAGTRALAEAAAARGVPRFVVAGDAKLVPKPVPVEEPFEATPLRLFTAVATPEGLLPPDEARARAREAPLHPRLRAMLPSPSRPSRSRPSRSRRRPE